MFHRSALATGLTLVALHTQGLIGADSPLPVRNGRSVVATVNRDAISLDEFIMQLGTPKSRARLQQGQATAEELALLDRMINIKLIVQEGTTMGLAEAPEIQKPVEVTSREILRELLMDRVTKDVKPDPVAVEKVFRDAVRQWKTTSVLFHEKAAAERARQEVAKGGAFGAVVSKAVAAKAAISEADPAFHPQKDFLPPIADALPKLRVGQVSPVIALQSGFVLVKVVDIRYPENPDARAEARRVVLSGQREKVLKAHEAAMRRQYVVVNEALLKSLDYEAAQPGVNALLVDKRIVAEIKGGASVTVGDLTDYLRMQFFHGSDQPKQHKEMNAQKRVALDATVSRRLLNMEAVKLGIDKTASYRDRVNGYRDSAIFDSFIQKVIAPDNKMREDEVQGYYKVHLDEYSSPEMMKVRSLAFTQRGAAEAAIRKLREGTDYGWLAANAEGQAARDSQDLLTLDGRPVMTNSMPDGVRKALTGSKTGDLRLYASPEGRFYVLSVQQVIASTPKPYDDVRQEIARKLYSEKLKKSVADYTAKLRAHSKVSTYLKKVR